MFLAQAAVVARRPGSPASPAASWESEEITAMSVTRALAQASYVGGVRRAGPPATGVAGAVVVVLSGEGPPATGVAGAVGVLGEEREPTFPCQAPFKAEMVAAWVPGDAVGGPEGSLCLKTRNERQ